MAEKNLNDISATPFDLVVIGAGINGAGIARDAAMRGLKVLLLDKGDIGGGTSSWSTRLIHGGLRYLEHGEFGLVRESLRERECLLNIAPHLVKPLSILVPLYKHARRGPWTMRAGMFAYEALSFDKTLPSHRMLSRAEALEEAPALEAEGLVGAAIYFDAQVEFPERLVLENAMSAVEHGAHVMTYARVNEFIVEEGMVRGVEFTTELDGEHRSARCSAIVNAAGPWVDQVLRKIGSSDQLIGGTKGSHLVVAQFPGAPPCAIYVEAETDHRPFFIIPWNGHYLIGTTDIRYNGNLDHPRIGAEEIDYLLRETNRVIPTANLSRDKILYTYSGVRPLPFTDNKDEQRITRRHFIRQHPDLRNLLSIVGGKLTTYRSLAQETVDRIFKKLGHNIAKCETAQTPLPGSATPDFDAFGKDFKQYWGLPEAISGRLLRIYGVRSASVLKLIAADPPLAQVFDDETRAIAAEIVYGFKTEMAQTLSDCLLRRTMVGLNSASGLNALETAAKIAQKCCGWSEERVANEISRYRRYVEGSLTVGVKELRRSAR